MKRFTRTDLACEVTADELPAELCREEKEGDFLLQRMTLAEPAHAALMGKPLGQYVTVLGGDFLYLSNEQIEGLTTLLGRELRALCESAARRRLDRDFSALVVGLGNEDITPDAIGPRAVRRLTATRHLRGVRDDLYGAVGMCELSALCPGVVGQTGIETAELVKGAVEKVRPDVVVAIDALAARSVERLASTVQLSDGGISPGSGMGNHRKAIDRESLGVPVVALGVPTVIESSTLVYEALEKAGFTEEMLSDDMIRGLEAGRGFFVSPKDGDLITESVSRLLTDSLELAFRLWE